MDVSSGERATGEPAELLPPSPSDEGLPAARPTQHLPNFFWWLGLIGLDTSHAPTFTKLINDPHDPFHIPGARVVAAYPGGSPDMEFYVDLKAKFGMKSAAVVWYSNSSQSAEAGQSFVKALKAEGVQTYGYAENVGLPQWDSDVLSMKSHGVKFLFDSIDIGGNQNLCKSIDSNHLVLTAKVSTISTWAQSVGKTFDYPCRTYIYSSDIPGTLDGHWGEG